MKQLLENLIKDWWIRPLPKIIARDVNLEDFANLEVKKIVSVVGFRRSGKTYALLDLAKRIGQKNCVYLNLEDERLLQETETLTALLELLREISGNKPYYLLLDEIQNIPNWSLWARRVNETTHHRLFISGSSSKLSSAQLPTELRGRSLTVHIQPLGFKEFLYFKSVDIEDLPIPDILNLTREYLTYGGFPEIVLVEEGKKPLLLDEYYQTFLTRDVIERHHLRNEEAIKVLIQLLFNSSSYTISKITNSLKTIGYNVSKATVMRYLDYLEESFLLSSLTLHTPNIKNRLKAPKKPYFVDSYFLSRYSTAFSQNLGKIMENVAASHLQKLLKSDPALNLYYWKDYQNHEVDFVLRKNEKVERLIQVSFASKRQEIAERELRSLLKANLELSADKLFLVTWDLEQELEVDKTKIACLPLYKWLF